MSCDVHPLIYCPLFVGGVDCESEAVLSCHSGEELYVPVQTGRGRGHALPPQRHDGATQVLQPSIPHTRSVGGSVLYMQNGHADAPMTLDTHLNALGSSY